MHATFMSHTSSVVARRRGLRSQPVGTACWQYTGASITAPRWLQVYELVPDGQHGAAARLLAQLQAIKRVELTHAADAAAAALELVNAAEVYLVPENDWAGSAGSGGDDEDGDDWEPAATAADSMHEARHCSSTNTSSNISDAHTPGSQSRTASSSSSSSSSGSCGGGGLAGVSAELRHFEAKVRAGPLSEGEAARLDSLFMEQLLDLAAEAHFAGAATRFIACSLSQAAVQAPADWLQLFFSAQYFLRPHISDPAVRYSMPQWHGACYGARRRESICHACYKARNTCRPEAA